jgi:hypothetical protein
MTIRRATLLAAALLAGGITPLLAAPVRDAATGLSVDPPAGYAANAVPATQGQAPGARIAIRRTQDNPQFGCQAAFAPASQNARLSQAQINETMGQSDWREAAQKAVSTLYTILSTELVENGAVRATVMVADLKPDSRLPAGADRIRTYFAIMETPRGRTNLVCVAEKDSFPARRAEFDAILRGTTAP